MTTPALPIVHRAQGAYLYDENGFDYLDGSSGVLNVNIGHGHPAVSAAITDQLERVTFVHRTQFRSRPAVELVEELRSIAPDGAGHVELCNSGSEANETAMRIALAAHHRRGATGRVLFLSEQPSYHGVTAATLGLTGQPAKRDASLTPLLTNGTTTDRVRAQGGLRAGVDDWSRAFDRVGRERIAGVFVEPLGGSSSGAAPVDDETLRFLRAEADRHGFLLIADEVMSGFGRSGRWWACDHAGVAPDMLTSGKGLTGGYTSHALTFVADHLVETFADGGTPMGKVVLGHTMSANPLAAAVCLAVLRVLREIDAPRRARERGAALATALDDLVEKHPSATEVRGRGLMLALGLAAPQDEPLVAPARMMALAREHGLVLTTGGTDADSAAVMIAPPLTITGIEADDLVERLDRTLTAYDAEIGVVTAGASGASDLG